MLAEYKTKLSNRPPKCTISSLDIGFDDFLTLIASDVAPSNGDAATSTTTAPAGAHQQIHSQPVQPAQTFPTTSHTIPAPAAVPNASSILASLARQPASTPLPVQPAPVLAPQPPASASGLTTEQANALASVIPPHVANDPAALAQHLQILQQLAEMGVPADTWPAVIQALHAQQNGQPIGAPAAMPTAAPPQRSRSRSPDRNRGAYGGSSYRNRSPLRGNSPSLQADTIMLNTPTEKWTDYDSTLPAGNIKGTCTLTYRCVS